MVAAVTRSQDGQEDTSHPDLAVGGRGFGSELSDGRQEKQLSPSHPTISN